MPLPAAEHKAVRRQSKDRRNATARNRRAALARAWAWVGHYDAKVVADTTPTGLLYTVSVPGLHAQTAQVLSHAVDILAAHVEDWCASPATHGPTGAKLDRLRAKRASWGEARRGD